MLRDFSTSSIARRKVSRICVTFGEHWFRDAVRICRAISIADARKPEIPAICDPASILLFSLPERNPLLHPHRCVAGSAILSRAFSHSLPSSLSFLPLLHCLYLPSLLLETNDPTTCCTADGKIDLFTSQAWLILKIHLFVLTAFLFFDNVLHYEYFYILY